MLVPVLVLVLVLVLVRVLALVPVPIPHLTTSTLAAQIVPWWTDDQRVGGGGKRKRSYEKYDKFGKVRFCLKSDDKQPSWWAGVARAQDSTNVAEENARRRRRRRGGAAEQAWESKNSFAQQNDDHDSSLPMVKGADNGGDPLPAR